MKHIKLFESFDLEKDMFVEIGAEEYSERTRETIDITKALKELESKYGGQLSMYPAGNNRVIVIRIIEKRTDGTNGDNCIEMNAYLTDDDWFLVCMDEEEWAGSWGTRWVWRGNGIEEWREPTDPSLWKCDQLEGLIALIDRVREDIWDFLTKGDFE
mgnify:CR=1 FL=1